MSTIRAKVTGSREVAGVATGGSVDLDPETVNIDALVVAGHIALTKPEARKQHTPGDGGS